MSKKLREKIIKTTLGLAAKNGWEHTTFYDISITAKIPLEELFDIFTDKEEILLAYGKQIDEKLLKNIDVSDETLSCRDKLFDIFMDRFELLNEDRSALISILKDMKCDLKQILFSLPHLGKSISRTLEAVGISTDGIKGCLRITGLSGVYIKTLYTWMDDDSADMSKTMAALDKNLGHAEKFVERFGL